MKPEKLMNLLAQLPPDCDVNPNAVGNLMVLNESGEYLGWIDFTEGTLEIEIAPTGLCVQMDGY